MANIYHSELIKLTQSQAGQWSTLQDEKNYQDAQQKNALIQHQILNPLCGDQITWHCHIKHGNFELLAHETIGCILCQAASILTYQQLINQSIAQLDKIMAENSMNEKTPLFVNQWEIFSPVLSVKSRLKCVSLPLIGLQELLSKH